MTAGRHIARWVGALALLASLGACPDKASGPPGDDRLLQKLKAEKEREAREGPTVAPTPVEPLPPDQPVNPLAEFAAKGTQRRELRLPAKTTLQLGKTFLRLNGLEATHTVGQGISITSHDWFVAVTVIASGTPGAEFDLSQAHLELGGQSFGHARDAQAASRQPARVLVSTEGTAVTAFFEVPATALGPGLALVVPDGASTARLELQ